MFLLFQDLNLLYDAMKYTKENWKEANVNLDSLWIIGPRAKGGKRENNYHGNFAPQIPDDLIRRFTDPDEVVLDMFMGSGTVLYECEQLKRRYIGFDINDEIIDYVKSKMLDSDHSQFRIFNRDIRSEQAKVDISTALSEFGKKKVDIIFSHPPYMDIVKFSDKSEDLSRIGDLDEFRREFTKSVSSVWPYLKKGGHFALVIGDVYKESAVIPLGFYLMDEIIKNFKCKMKGILIKDMVGNRGKIGMEALARFRALNGGYYIFKHEYVFIFRKM